MYYLYYYLKINIENTESIKGISYSTLNLLPLA